MGRTPTGVAWAHCGLRDTTEGKQGRGAGDTRRKTTPTPRTRPMTAGTSRSITSVAFDAFTRAEQAQRRADKASAELKRWVRELNEVEKAEFEAQCEAWRVEHKDG